MSDSDQDIIPPARAFAQFLIQLGQGEYHEQCSEALRDVVAQLQDLAALGRKVKGKITLAFELTYDDGVFEVRPDLAVKLPKPTPGKSIFWATPDNNLTPQNPRQMRLPLRDVAGEREVRSI